MCYSVSPHFRRRGITHENPIAHHSGERGTVAACDVRARGQYVKTEAKYPDIRQKCKISQRCLTSKLCLTVDAAVTAKVVRHVCPTAGYLKGRYTFGNYSKQMLT